MWHPWQRKIRREEDREDVFSDDAGRVTFNYLQQRQIDTTESPWTPVEEAGGTDPDGITTG